MPELLSEEETRAAFAELRATELGRVLAPGTEAVRTTVRRRKTGRAVMVAGCAALVVVGGVAVAPNLAVMPDRLDSLVGPRPEQPDALGWAQLADEALDRGNDDLQSLASARGPLNVASYDVSYAGTSTAYNLIITCAGNGTVHVKVAVGTHTAESDVACGATKSEAAKATTEVALAVGDSREHDVAVSVAPDAAALNKAGFAYVLKYS